MRRRSREPAGVISNVFTGSDAYTLTSAGVVVPSGAGESLWAPIPPATIDTTYVPHTGTVFLPINASEFQIALNSSVRGDIIVLQNGTVYEGNFNLPGKTGTQPINIVSEAFFNGAVTKGVSRRVLPADVGQMAIVRTPNSAPCIDTLNGGPNASYYRFEWIKFDVLQFPSFSGSAQFGLIRFSYSDNLSVNGVEVIPRNLFLSHCWIDGRIGAAFGDVKKGIEFNCREGAVIDSYVEIGKGTLGQETHAIDGWKGPGPFKIDNDYLEAPGINVLFGGVNNAEVVNTQGASQPADISTTRCHLFKNRTAWFDVSGIVIKNWYETKNSVRNLFQGNVCTTMWGNQGQSGHPILMQNTIGPTFTNLDQWMYQQIRDTHLIYNKFIDGSGGPNVPATINRMTIQPGTDFAPEPVTRWRCEHNLWFGISATSKGGGKFGRLYSPTGPGRYVSLDFNTYVLGSGEIVNDIQSLYTTSGSFPHSLYGIPIGSRMRGNITCFGKFGYFGDGGFQGELAVNPVFDQDMDYSGNVAYGDSTPSPSANYNQVTNQYLSNIGAVLFTDEPNGDYTLQGGSPAVGFGPGGADAGADITRVDLETKDCISGQWVTSPPLTLSVFTLPSDASDGVAFGAQPVVLAAPGIVVTASLDSGPGTLTGSLTAIAGSDSLATFQRLRIDGGVGSLHIINFSAPGWASPLLLPSITPVASTPGAVQVDESTVLQVWEGTNEVAQIMQYEAVSQAVYDADKDAVLDLITSKLGPLTVIVDWRIGNEHTIDRFVEHGPFPGGAWGAMLADLYGTWVPVSSGGTIFHTKQAHDMTEVYVPLRTKAAATGLDKPRIQILYQADINEPDGFRPTSPTGDGDGTKYAARILDLVQWMETTYSVGINQDVEISLENEPNFSGKWTPTDFAHITRATNDLLAANGYTPRILLPNTSSETACVAFYNDTIAAAGGKAAGIPGAISFHRYGRSLAARQAIAALASSENIPAVMTEWGIKSGTVQQSWEDCVSEAQCSGWSLFVMAFGTDPTSDGVWINMFGDGVPKLTNNGRFASEYCIDLKRTSQRIGCTETHASVVTAYCFVRPDGKHVVKMRSTAAIGALTVGGLPAGIYGVRETTATTDHVDLGNVVVANGGVATISPTAAGVITMLRQ